MFKKIALSVVLFAASVAASANYYTDAEARLKADFNAFVTNPATLPNAGDTMPWASGVIVRNAQRQLIYTNLENGFAQFNLTQMTTDPAELLKFGGLSLKKLWANQYGVDTSRIPGVQAQNAAYWTAIMTSRQPYGVFTLGGNGSLTAVFRNDSLGRCMQVEYDNKITNCTEFQRTNWFRSITGSPGL